MKYNLVRNMPVARFWYKGHHTHPVRRTILVIESTPHLFVGYEVREGRILRKLQDAPIKSYRKDKIANTYSLRPDAPLRRENPNASTLKREKLLSLIETGF
jgi:hypothetical protein